MSPMSPRLLRPRASGDFSPKTITGLQLWLDASDASTLFDATTGGALVTANGAVARWQDKSGNGRHATQTTANNRPAYNGVIGGKAALTFDGANDAMATGLLSASLTGYATFFCVCRPNFADVTAANLRTPMYGRDSSTTSNSYGINLFNNSGTLLINTQWRGAQFNSAGGPTVTLGIDAIMVGGVTPTQHVRRVSGVAANLSVAATAGTNSAAGNFLNVGQDPTQNRWWNGPIGEVLVYNRDLSLAEIQTVERYLTTKWAIGSPLSTSTSGWTGNGSEATKLARATLTGTNTNSNTITINSAGLLRITATTSGAGDGTGGLMTIVAAGQTYTGNSGGSGGSWTIDITKTVTVGQTITFASEYADGTFNSLQAWIIPPAAPPAPTSLTSPSQSSGSVYLTWAAPANDGGSAITDYAVQYSSDSGSNWTTFSRSASTALNATITGLTNGTSYQFRVAGVNSVGTGSYSSTATATPTAGNSLTASGWSGAGTSASKLAPPASPATFTSSPSISVATSGTLNVSIVSDDNYNDAWEVIIRRNGTAVYSNDGNAANGTTFTVAVTAGQTIALETSGGGARWFAGTRLWVS